MSADFLDTLSFYPLTMVYAATIFVGCAIIVSLYYIFQSLRFNYHYYIRYGEFLIRIVDNHDYKALERMGEIKNQMRYTGPVEWLLVLLVSIGAIVCGGLLAAVWPVAAIAILPLAITRLLASRKRTKAVFTEKLKGTYAEGQ